MGIGGEWAVATAMIAETVPDRARARFGAIFHASSVFGTYLATLVAVVVIGNRNMQEYAESVGMPSLTWRVAFVLGVLPALLTLWIRLRLRDPERPQAAQDRAAAGRVRDLFSSSLASRTLLGAALASIGLATFWGVHVFGKDTMRDLGRRRILALEQLEPDSAQSEKDAVYGKHNAQVKRFEMLGMFLVTTGGGLGLLAFGPLCEWLGRRGAFLFYHLGGFAAGVTLFQVFAQADFATLCVALPIFGFLTLGMHAGYAVYFPELYPARLRGAGGGFCFNFGRVIAALILLATGTLQKEFHWTVQNSAIALSGLYLLGLIILVFAPETKGRALPE
jgi:MFS family permease